MCFFSIFSILSWRLYLRGIILRSTINWYGNGKKIQCFFLSLENIRSGKTDVRRTFDSNRKITLNPKTILNDLKKYYQSLYRDRDYNLSDELCSDLLDSNSILTLMVNLRCYVMECSCSWNATMGYKKSPMVVKLLVKMAFLLNFTNVSGIY